MKYFNIILVFFLLLSSCKQQKPQPENTVPQASQKTFTAVGAPLTDGDFLPDVEMTRAYADMQTGDTLFTRFEAEVLSVCQNKGCWMQVALPEDKTVMVRFKDYGFFVPKDIAGKRVLVEGKAFVSEITEEERRHMADDAGKSDSLIALIKGSEVERGFEASGVRIY